MRRGTSHSKQVPSASAKYVGEEDEERWSVVVTDSSIGAVGPRETKGAYNGFFQLKSGVKAGADAKEIEAGYERAVTDVTPVLFVVWLRGERNGGWPGKMVGCEVYLSEK
ncbi:MAG: hypothetical protein Q9210_000675 [Variospora velana]